MRKPISPRPPRRGRLTPRLLIGAGLVFLLAAGGWQLHAALWINHYHKVGGALVHQEEANLANAPGVSNGVCKSTTTPNGPQGLLNFPELGVVAPVEQGQSDATLSVAVGHNTDSVWPGQNGTTVFTSHDVTYFVNIDKLKAGQEITYLTPCVTFTYKVTSQKVVTAGDPIYNTAGPSLALVTCWPTNALFFTNNRLVVYLTQVSATAVTKANKISGSSNGILTSDAKQPAVALPAALAEQGLTLATNYAPMGTLTILGKANPAYVQSPAPLLAQDAGLVVYFAGLKSLAQQHVDWWAHFAKGVTPPAQLIGHSISSYTSPLNVYIEAHGDAVTGVAMRSGVVIDGHSYTMNIGTAISNHNVMRITSWTIS